MIEGGSIGGREHAGTYADDGPQRLDTRGAALAAAKARRTVTGQAAATPNGSSPAHRPCMAAGVSCAGVASEPVGKGIPVSLSERLDRLQRRHPGAGFPIAVLYKFIDDSGSYLAALITYYGFVSLFPGLLLLTTVLGLVLRGQAGLQQQILHSALSEFPVIGSQLGQPHQIGGGAAGLVIGSLGALYGGLGVAQAIQYAMNTAWQVPRNSRPNPLKARGRSLLLLATLGLTVLGTTVLSALGSSAGSYGATFGTGLHILFTVAAVLVNAAVFVIGFRVATARDLSVRQILPGALSGAVVWQMLQSFGGVYVGHVVKHASATNGVFATVLGLLAFLYLAAVAMVFCVEINVVRVDRLYPRALLTPFTDEVQLTNGDKRTYAGAAQAQRNKGFEQSTSTSIRPEFQAMSSWCKASAHGAPFRVATATMQPPTWSSPPERARLALR